MRMSVNHANHTDGRCYNCIICGKTYKMKHHYSNHAVMCDLMNKTKKERDIENIELDEIPHITKMYSLMVSMALKLEVMDKKVKHLTKINEIRIKKIDVLEWLNKTYKNGCFIDIYVNSLVAGRVHLEYLFEDEHSYVDTICNILKTASHDGEDLCTIIRSVEHNQNVLYSYSPQDTWVVLEDSDLEKIIYMVEKLLMGEFIKWQEENTHKTGTDAFDETYFKNMRKITNSYGKKYTAIKTTLYRKTKVDMPKY